MQRIDLVTALILSAMLAVAGCTEPQVPREVALAEEQELSLFRMEAQDYAPGEYSRYLESFRGARITLFKEQSRFVWFRDYRRVRRSFRAVLEAGYQLHGRIVQEKERREKRLAILASALTRKMEVLKGLTVMVNEGRLARNTLMRAEIDLEEARNRREEGRYRAAEARLRDASRLVREAGEALLPIFARYADRNLIDKWRRMAEDTIADSERQGIPVIIVNKSELSLVLYDRGLPVRSYTIGLGRNGSSDKLRAGDNSTPEGRYRITGKKSGGPYHKELMINYPNEEDRRTFRKAKRDGRIPAQATIGGMIEIHGGGRESMTYGCVAMDNEDIDEIYPLVSPGTPVTIVGAVDYENRLSLAIQGF